MKILNLYAGIGGNRKHWDGEKHDITAVEIDKETANIYEDHFPKDNVIVKDAHKKLKEEYQSYDFIWASPPCPTHSKIRNEAGVGRGQNKSVYPDMKLYQEIIFMERVKRTSGPHSFNGDYIIENVKPDYNPLIRPQKSQRHFFWSNFTIPETNIKADNINTGTVTELEKHHGFDLSSYNIPHKKKQKILRNCVHPKIGKQILEARNAKQTTLNNV